MKTKTIKTIVLALGLVACAGAMAHTSTVETTDGKGNIYNEGDVVHFRMALSAQNDTGKPIYAFLLCNEGVDLSLFGGTAAKAILTNADVAVSTSVGRQISSFGTYVDSSFTVLDAGQNYTFSVVLCSSKNYDPNLRLQGYDTTEMLNITVYNKEPKFTTVSLNGFEADSDGYTFPSKYPMGQNQTILPEFDDVSYDLKHGFEYKWTASCNGQTFASGTVAHDTTGNITETATTTNSTTYATVIPDGMSINEVPFGYHFPLAGVWTVTIQMKDKDMMSYSAVTYSISLVVFDRPVVTLDAEDMYLENDITAKFEVGLDYFDSADDIVVKLTVTPPSGTNPGALKLDSKFKAVPAGYPALAEDEYYVSFNFARTISVGIEEMDGTMLSSSRGFTVTAAVVSNGISVDPSMTWAEYYIPHQEKIYIENVGPVLGSVTPENMNAWVIVGGAASLCPIRWSIRSDVDADFTNKWAYGGAAGIRVSFIGCANAFTTNVTEAASGEFVPDFGTWLGQQSVTMMIEDKDGGCFTYTYLYEVLPQRYSATVDGVAWIYELCDAEKARIVGTDTTLTGNVTIPSELDGNVVVALAESALKNAHGVTGIVIPKSVVQIEDGAFSGLEEVLAQWYKSLAELVDGGTSYGLGENVADKTVASITVSDDATLGDFVLAKDKVYDSVVHIVNTADHEIRIILPEGYSYRVLKGSRPLTVPAHSECVLTITRLSAQIFLVTVAELEVLQ